MREHPDSVLSRDTDSGGNNGSLRADGRVEPTVSTSHAARKDHKGSAPLLSTGVRKTCGAFKPPVKSKGVGDPSSLDKENGVKTIANPLHQKKNVRCRFPAREIT